MTARKGEQRPAATLPVARVWVDVPLAHLDRPFDYLVPASLDDQAVPGCRVRVRFAGQQVDGFLAERVAESDFGGRLGFLSKVVSAEPVLAPEIAALARAVADRYAGTMIDVLRLAIPPRHAKVEAEEPPAPALVPAAPDPAACARWISTSRTCGYGACGSACRSSPSSQTTNTPAPRTGANALARVPTTIRAPPRSTDSHRRYRRAGPASADSATTASSPASATHAACSRATSR